MRTKTSIHRSRQEWMELITQCRQSGMSDLAWCNANGISKHTFYKAVARLRKAACEVPASVSKGAHKDSIFPVVQDVVPVKIVDQNSVPDDKTGTVCSTEVVDHYGVPRISVYIGNAYVQIENGVDPRLLNQTLRLLGEISC